MKSTIIGSAAQIVSLSDAERTQNYFRVAAATQEPQLNTSSVMCRLLLSVRCVPNWTNNIWNRC